MPIPNDPKERSNVFALVRGSGSRCVILTGHYDVVQTSMYGSLEPWAFDPETLQRKMLESLADISGKDNPLSRLKERPRLGRISSGRGILDMKGGLAAEFPCSPPSRPPTSERETSSSFRWPTRKARAMG